MVTSATQLSSPLFHNRSHYGSHHLPHPSTFVQPSYNAYGTSPVYLTQQQQALVQALAVQHLYKQLLAQQAQPDSFAATQVTGQPATSDLPKQAKTPSQEKVKHFVMNSLKVLALLALVTVLAGSARRMVAWLHPQQSLKLQELEDFQLLNQALDSKILHHLPKPLASGLALFLSPFKALLPQH
jgi:hypothetical protein